MTEAPLALAVPSKRAMDRGRARGAGVTGPAAADESPVQAPDPWAKGASSQATSRARQMLGADLDAPYEAALALAGSESTEDPCLRALVGLRTLEAGPAAAIVSRPVFANAASAGRHPGLRPSTRSHPANLTARELEVLALCR